MLGVAFPVGVGRVCFPFLCHFLEGVVGGSFAEGFIDPVVGPGAGLVFVDDNMGKLV